MLCKDKSCHKDLGIGILVKSNKTKDGNIRNTYSAKCLACGKLTEKTYTEKEVSKV